MYAKVFRQIFDSSINDDYRVRLVFEDLLKLCDVNGVVDMTVSAISRVTNVPLEIVSASIKKLEEPDPSSRSKTAEGRRIVRLDEHRDWGWMIVNYEHYRKMISEEDRREKTLARVKRFREKHSKSASSDTVTHCNAPVTDVNACNAMQREMEKQKNREEEREETAAMPPVPPVKIKVTKGKKKEPVSFEPEEQRLWDLWCGAFKESYGETYATEPSVDDARAVRELIGHSGKTVDYLIELAKRAWANQKIVACQNAGTLPLFRKHHTWMISSLKGAGKSIPSTPPPPASSATTPAPESERMDSKEFWALPATEKKRLVGGSILKNGSWLMPYEDWKLPLKSAV